MAKYYSPSTGQVTTGTPQTPSSSGGTYSTSGLPGQQSELQKLLGLYALSKGNPTGAWTILNADVTKGGLSGAERSRTQTGVQVLEDLKTTPMSIQKKTGGLGALMLDFKLNFPGGYLKPTISRDEMDLANLDQKYFMLTQAVMTAIQGSRPSDYDVKSYQDKAGPNIKLPYYINEQRINNLLNMMQSKLTAP